MISADFLQQAIERIDSRDAPGLAAVFTPPGQFRFGNAPALIRPEADESAVGSWAQEDTSLCHDQVNYTGLDGSELSRPFALVVKSEDKAISEYLIFVDNSVLFTPSA